MISRGESDRRRDRSGWSRSARTQRERYSASRSLSPSSSRPAFRSASECAAHTKLRRPSREARMHLQSWKTSDLDKIAHKLLARGRPALEGEEANLREQSVSALNWRPSRPLLAGACFSALKDGCIFRSLFLPSRFLSGECASAPPNRSICSRSFSRDCQLNRRPSRAQFWPCQSAGRLSAV